MLYMVMIRIYLGYHTDLEAMSDYASIEII